MSKGSKNKEQDPVNGGAVEAPDMDAANDPQELPTEAPTEAPEEAPKDAPKSSELEFKPIPASQDPYQMGFFKFDADGVTFTGKFVRLYAPGEHENLEHAAIEFTDYPGGAPWLLPGNTQLWNLLEHHKAEGVDFDNTVYRITRLQQVTDDKGKVKFVRFRTEVATIQ